MPNQKICCQSIVGNFHAAITLRFTTLRCKTQEYYACSCSCGEPWRGFRARPASNSKSWICANEAFVRGVLRIPRVEEMKTKLSCEASFKFQEVKKWTHLFNAAVPMHKVSQHMQNTIAQHHQRREKVTWNHQFHCAQCEYGKTITPETVAQASQLFSATELPFTRKNTMFRANPNIQIASLIHENEAFVRGVLQIPRVEYVQTKLSCEASFEFQELTWGSLEARAD